MGTVGVPQAELCQAGPLALLLAPALFQLSSIAKRWGHFGSEEPSSAMCPSPKPRAVVG